MVAAPFRSLDEIAAEANNSEYGLEAGIWTKDISEAHALAKKLRAGTVWINCYNVFDASLPFGGYKQSGWGREMGHEVLEAYTEVKAVTTQLQAVPKRGRVRAWGARLPPAWRCPAWRSAGSFGSRARKLLRATCPCSVLSVIGPWMPAVRSLHCSSDDHGGVVAGLGLHLTLAGLCYHDADSEPHRGCSQVLVGLCRLLRDCV